MAEPMHPPDAAKDSARVILGVRRRKLRVDGGGEKAQMVSGFWWACEYGRTSVVDFLLQRGVDVGAQQTGLHWAAVSGQLDTVKLFLERKAPLEARSKWGTPVLGTAV